MKAGVDANANIDDEVTLLPVLADAARAPPPAPPVVSFEPEVDAFALLGGGLTRSPV